MGIRICFVLAAFVAWSTFIETYAKRADLDRVIREGTIFAQKQEARLNILERDLNEKTLDRIHRSEWARQLVQHEKEHLEILRSLEAINARISKQWDRVNKNSLKIEGAHGRKP